MQRTLIPPGREVLFAAACPRCERPLHLGESHRRRAVRCPGCGAPLTVPEGGAAPAPLAAPTILEPPAPPAPSSEVAEKQPSWRSRLLLLTPPLLAVGIPLCARGSLPATGLAVGLGLACLLLGQWGRWRPAVRLLLTLTLTGLGYGVAFAVLVPDPPPSELPGVAPMPEPMSRWGLMSPTMMARMGQPIPPNLAPAGAQQPIVSDLEFVTRIGDLLSIAVHPKDGFAFVSRADGALDHYSYPKFERRGTFRLAQPGYRLALDGKGRLFAAASDPGALCVNRYGDRPEGRGDLHVYDIRTLLAARPADGPRTPDAVIPLDGDVRHLLPAPDGGCLYYLVHRPDGDMVGRISTASLTADVRIRPDGGVTALALSPDGKGLYAAGPRLVRVLDPATLRVRRSIPVEPLVADLEADNAGRLYLAEAGQWTEITIVNAGGEGEVLARWKTRLHGRIYLHLLPNGRRLYFGTSSLVSSALRCWQLRDFRGPTPTQFGQVSTDNTGPVRGEFFITPDGRYLVSRWGKIYQLAPQPEVQKPSPGRRA